jgi:hypothetical protein
VETTVIIGQFLDVDRPAGEGDRDGLLGHQCSICHRDRDDDIGDAREFSVEATRDGAFHPPLSHVAR